MENEFNKIHLVADGSEFHRKILKHFLKNRGYFVKEVTSGENLIDIVHDNKDLFSIVWLDTDMVDLDGCQCTEILREDLDYQGIIVGITSNVDNNQIIFCKQVGMNEVLLKPYKEEDLESIIEKYNLCSSDNLEDNIVETLTIEIKNLKRIESKRDIIL